MSPLDPIPVDNDEETTPEPVETQETEAQPIELSDVPLAEGESKIRAFGKRKKTDKVLHRAPNVTGQGAIHVKTFHAKLREDAFEFMEQQINDWLETHPEYEVKYVTSSIGDLKSKLGDEQAIFLTVWV